MITLRRRFKRELTLLLWHTVQRLDAALPRPARFLVATALGEVAYWLLPGKRAAALDNMRRVLGPDTPESEVRAVARRSFRNYAKYLSEFSHLPRWREEDLETLMSSVRGWEYVQAAVAEGKGVIFVTPHFGNWDIAGWFFGKRHPFWAVAEPLEPPELDALVQGWRRAKHINIIPLAHGARGVLRALHAGGFVALVADRPTHARGDGANVRFFGEWTRLPAGPAHFALKTGAPVIVCGVWRTPSNTYAGFALPPLRFTPSADRRRDVDAAMQRVVEQLEQVIRAHPDQWYMFRRMWPARAAELSETELAPVPVSV